MLKELLTNPFVLTCAWQKLQTWYQTEWAPEPEWTRWQQDPWPHMIEVAEALASDSFQCSPMPLVPYPKKGGEIRHYVMPTVRDQYAHLIFAVLLAPFIESQLPNVVLGNRWYRGVRRKYPVGNQKKGKWQSLPFSLSDRELFEPYKRAHGLFRRLAAWTAGKFTNGKFDVQRVGDPELHPTPNDFPDSQLPYISDRFQLFKASDGRLCYARLDLAKAFPSVHRNDVRNALLEIVSSNITYNQSKSYSRWEINISHSSDINLIDLLGPNQNPNILESPWHFIAGKEGENIRFTLALRWMNLLEKATYLTKVMDHDLSDVLSPILYEDQSKNQDTFGLPTGLAVSPILLNVALQKLDINIIDYLEETAESEKLKGAYLRFADDIILMAVDEPTLRGCLETIHETLKQYTPYGPELFPKINLQKIKPESVKRWFQAQDFASPIQLKMQDFIHEEHRSEFVTDVVQHMSMLAHESIVDRYSQRAFQRINQLQDLARWDIQDLEVRPDTRLSFSVTKLTRARIPDSDPSETQKAIEEIRRTVRMAIRQAPWKYSLWRSAIRAALRAEPGENAFSPGMDWLEKMLQLIAVGGTWEQEWPYTDSPTEPSREDYPSEDKYKEARDEWLEWKSREDSGLRSARLSFLRATFWRYLSECILQLNRAKKRIIRNEGLPTGAWYAAILDRQTIQEGLNELLNTDRWVATLYGEFLPPSLPPWELESIKIALAACLSTLSDPSGLGSPAISVQPHLSRLAGLALDPTMLDGYYKFGYEALEQSSVRGKIALLAQHAAETANALEFNKILTTAIQNFKNEWRSTYPNRHNKPHYFASALWFYEHLRSMLWSHQTGKKWLKMLTRIVVDSKPEEERELLRTILWQTPTKQPIVDPTQVPAVGLSTPWSIKIFADVLTDSNIDPYLPIEVAIDKDWCGVIRHERASSLQNGLPGNSSGLINENMPNRVAYWQIPQNIPPHPASFLPGWFQWSHTQALRWHAVLAISLAINGDESFHNSIYSKLKNNLPWSENLFIRCKMLLPTFVWAVIDQATGWTIKSTKLEIYENKLTEISSNIELMIAGSAEIVTSIKIENNYPVIEPEFYTPINNNPFRTIKDGLPSNESQVLIINSMDEDSLYDELIVRLSQISAKPLWSKNNSWPHSCEICKPMMKQVIQSLASLEDKTSNEQPNIIVFPEISIHPDNALECARYAATNGTGLLSGLYWHEIQPAVRPAKTPSNSKLRHFVNEAILAVPHPNSAKYYQPYIFRIRKPRPAHIEFGVQEALTRDKGTLGKWRILPGQEWLRFVHPKWGPFAVAICSDILDIGPWARLKGHILHVFLVAWNTDVPLYDSMTWTRAYELFVNLAAVNHGEHGGTLAWTPKHDHKKSIFSVKGENHYVTTDAKLPIKKLAASQEHYRRDLLTKNRIIAESFLNTGNKNKKIKLKKSDFKSPPVSFDRYW